MKKKINSLDKSVITNILGSFGIKGLALIISFFTMPAYIKYFNDDLVLGLWFTILSILGWVLTFDFGIGNGLRNHMIQPLENNNKEEVRTFVSSAYIVLGKITGIIALVLIPLLLFLNWNKILNVPGEILDKQFLISVLSINFLTIVLQFFLRIISSVIYALQKSVINNLMTLITSIIQLIFVLVFPSISIKINLIILSTVHLVTTILPLIIATIVIFNTSLKGMTPSFKYYDKTKAKLVLNDGTKIFVNQIFYLLLTGINAFLITYFIGNEQVVEYQQYYKIFMMMGTLYMLALTPMWSAVTKAQVNNDYKWIKKYYKILLLGSLLVSFAQFLIIPILQFGFNIWLGDSAPTVNYWYAVIFALYGGGFTIQLTLSTFAMGFNKTKTQAVLYGVAVILKFVSLLLVVYKYQHWSLIVLIDFIVVIPYIIAEYFSLKKYIKEGEKKEWIKD